MKWSPKSLSAFILTATICIILIMTFTRFMMYPPGTVLDETRDKMFQLVTFIAGIVSGWVLYGETHAVPREGGEEKKEEKEEEEKKK